MRLVVDSSVALKWFLHALPSEQNVAEAFALVQRIEVGGGVLFAPPHWIAEVIGVLARTDLRRVQPALEMFDGLSPFVVSKPPIIWKAAELSNRLRHHLFDTLYHAVAMEMEATLVTADDAYFDKAKPLGNIMRLADFPT